MVNEATVPATAERLVVLAASAGGPLALGTVIEGLPATLEAAVIVILHLPAEHRSLLPQILARRSLLPVKEAEENDVLLDGHVYVAPPDAHLLVRPDRTLTLDHSPALHYHRPSIDLSLASAAAAYGDRAIAVVLTGSGSDGADGVRAVKEAGGAGFPQGRGGPPLRVPRPPPRPRPG